MAALVHGELASLAPFGSADGVVARAAGRLTGITRGLDPKAVSVPEVGFAELGREAYAEALAGYAVRDPAGCRRLARALLPGDRARRARGPGHLREPAPRLICAAARASANTGRMEYLEIDGLGPVSRIGLGTWQFGSREWGYGDTYADRAARDIVRRARELGITLFDTAEVYGFGRSERILGRGARPRARRGRRRQQGLPGRAVPRRWSGTGGPGAHAASG